MSSQRGPAAEAFEHAIRAGEVVLFPSDTVYGLACDPENAAAVRRLYEVKRRAPDKAAAVMFFELEAALAALPELGERTRAALVRLLPGAITALVPNPARRFALACKADPETLGVRVVSVPELRGASVAVLQSSANLSGGADARRLEDVADEIRAAVALQIDGGELPGVPSTVVDLREYERGLGPGWRVVRAGAVSEQRLAAELDGQYHFNPATYECEIRADIPAYDRLQEQLVRASGTGARRILELGTGTGETAARLLASHPQALLVGIDESPAMLQAARARLPAERVRLSAQRLQQPLPQGPFDLVASALCVHHLDGGEKRDLFARVLSALAPQGRFVLADVVRPAEGVSATIGLTEGYDKPSTVAEQLDWLSAAGFGRVEVIWQEGDLAVLVGAASR
jgi:tRNA threonylcarbamoyl adenosine modification protein (Sua5/YciO/YrdC/YwlC family)